MVFVFAFCVRDRVSVSVRDMVRDRVHVIVWVTVSAAVHGVQGDPP